MCLFNEFEANRVGIRKKFLNAEHVENFTKINFKTQISLQVRMPHM